MKKISVCFLLFVIFFVGFNLIVHFRSFAFFDSVVQSETITFATGEWVSAETEFLLLQSGKQYSNKESVISYVDIDQDKYQIEITDATQFLSFYIKDDSQNKPEFFEITDVPQLTVFIGDVPVSQLSIQSVTDAWHQVVIDLSRFTFEKGIYDIHFTNNNVFDSSYKPNFQIRDMTTTQLFVTENSVLQFRANKPVSLISVSYFVYEDSKEVSIVTNLVKELKNNEEIYQFFIPKNLVGNEIKYWSEDLFGNKEAEKVMNISYFNNANQTDSKDKVIEVQVNKETENEVSVFFEYENQYASSSYFIAEAWSDNFLKNLAEKKHHQFMLPQIYYFETPGFFYHNLVYTDVPPETKKIILKRCYFSDFCQIVTESPL